MNYQHEFTTKWADFDPNRHMRHSAYTDYAAEIRVRFFAKHGLSMDEFIKLNMGPILFKEETTFFKEINIGEDIVVDMTLESASEKFERWRFTHRILNAKGQVAAEVKVYGAWINLVKRALTTPPDVLIAVFKDLPKSEDFKVIPLKNR